MKIMHEDTMMQAPVHQSLARDMSFKKQHLWIDRKDKRISLSLPCQVRGTDERACAGRIINLSAGGMKFACNRETFELLLPEGQRTPGMISGFRQAGNTDGAGAADPFRAAGPGQLSPWNPVHGAE